MRLTLRDLVATLLVVAIGVPYVGYLVSGEMPFVQDARGMSAVGLVLGAVAFLVLRTGDQLDRAGKMETALVVFSLAGRRCFAARGDRVRRAAPGGVHGVDPRGVGCRAD